MTSPPPEGSVGLGGVLGVPVFLVDHSFPVTMKERLEVVNWKLLKDLLINLPRK